MGITTITIIGGTTIITAGTTIITTITAGIITTTDGDASPARGQRGISRRAMRHGFRLSERAAVEQLGVRSSVVRGLAAGIRKPINRGRNLWRANSA